MPCISLAVLQILNLAYCMYKILQVDKKNSLVNGSKAALAFACVAIIFAILGAIKVSCLAYRATKVVRGVRNSA